MAASPSPTSDEQFAIGSVLDDRYRIDGILGTGGMGRVYRAEHTKIGKPVAIKVLHADLHRNREASQRFQREAIASGRLDHPNIVGVIDFGELDDGACYLVMEVLEGESLGDRLARDDRIPWPEAIDILRGVLAGLRHAHERGVVHRDIKPDNVYLAHKDGEAIIKILDFGIAKLYAGNADDPAATRAGLTVGTPAYLSPEQAVGGEITPASDLYSASIVLYEMLVGHAPFEDRDPLAMLGAHVGRRPPAFAVTAPGIEIPPALEDIVQHGLAKAAAERISSATDYLALLDSFAPPLHKPRLSTSPSAGLSAQDALGLAATGTAIAAWPPAAPLEAVHTTTPLPAAMMPGRVTPMPNSVLTPVPGSVLTPVPGSVLTPVPGVMTPYAGTAVVQPTGALTPYSGSVVVAQPPSASQPYAAHPTGAMPRAARMVSLADVTEPIPKTWIVRSGIVVIAFAVIAIVLGFVKHCGSASDPTTPAATGSGSAAAPASTGSGSAATKPAANASSSGAATNAGSGSAATPAATGAGSGSASADAAGAGSGSGAGSAATAKPTKPPGRPHPGRLHR